MVIDPFVFLACVAIAQCLALVGCLTGALIYYRGSGRTNPIAKIRELAQKNPEAAVKQAVVLRKQLQDEADNVIRRLAGKYPELLHSIPQNGQEKNRAAV